MGPLKEPVEPSAGTLILTEPVAGASVPLRRARTIDEIAEATAGHDLVLTSDAPLALALNRRTPEARLGQHAATPLNHARRGLEVPGRRELFCTLVSDTELSFKQAATLLELALSAWEETGDAEAILAWERYETPQMRTVLDVVQDQPNGHRAREQVTVPDGTDVAVVGLDRFSALDRAVLPDAMDDVTVIDPFVDGEHATLAPFRVLPNTAGIVATLREHITPANATDVGIVLDPAGTARPLVEAMLDARAIPYHTETELTERTHVRTFLRLLRLGLANRRLTGRDVRGVLVALGLPAWHRHDDRRLESLSTEGAQTLARFWRDTREATLKDAIRAFEDVTEASLTDLREAFEDLGVLDGTVDRRLLDALDFYLDAYRLDDGYTREGVLLASATANAYVDRPIVFHVGIGPAWAPPTPAYPWIDREQREARETARFERLVQNGDPPVYLVQDTRQGQPVTPCFTLHELLDVEFERFTDLPHTEHAPAPRDPTPVNDAGGLGVEHAPPSGVEPVTRQTVSASTLDRLATCPRDWAMDQLVTEPERDYFEKGHLLHAFAEFYVEHPELVDLDDAGDRERLVEIALDGMRGLVDEDELPAVATELAIAMRNTARWLDEHPPTGEGTTAYADPPEDRAGADGANRFADAFDVEIDLGLTERWFEDPDVGLHGKVDLVHAGDHLVDWKTTKRPDGRSRTIRRARVGSDEDEPRFQPAAYLAHHRRAAPGAPLRLTFLDVLANHRDVISGTGDLGDIERVVRYLPRTYQEHVATEHAFSWVQAANQNLERVLGELGYPAFRDIFDREDLPAFEDKDAAAAHPVRDVLMKRAKAAVGDYKYVEKAARSTMKKLVELREAALFEEDLDAFDAFVRRCLDALDRWRATRFPLGDADLSDTRHEDLLLRHLGPDPPSDVPPLRGGEPDG